MTYRLCVIGNSHVAAFKLGWDQLAAQKDARIAGLAPTFFGAPRDGVKAVAVREGRLVPLSESVAAHFVRLSGGRSEIDPILYDGFLLVGLGASMKRVLRLYRTHRWYGVQQSAGCTVASLVFVQDFLAEGYAGTRLAQVAQMLAGLTDKPVFATPEPYWAAMPSQSTGKKGDFGWARAAASGDGEKLAEVFAVALAAALGHHAGLMLQPAATVEHGIVTRAIYNKGASKMITGGGDESDAAHMNGDYGAVWWTEAVRTFGVADPAPAKAPGKMRKRA